MSIPKPVCIPLFIIPIMITIVIIMVLSLLKCNKVTQESLQEEIHQLVYDADLREITQRTVFTQLSKNHGVDLDEFKPFIYEV